MVDGKPITDFKTQTASSTAAKAGEQAASASPRNLLRSNSAVRRSLNRADSSGNLNFAAMQSRVQQRRESLQDEAAADAHAAAQAIKHAADKTNSAATTVENPLSSASVIEKGWFEGSTGDGGSDSPCTSGGSASTEGRRKRLGWRLHKHEDAEDKEELQSGDDSPTLSPLQLGQPARTLKAPLTLDAEAEEEV